MIIMKEAIREMDSLFPMQNIAFWISGSTLELALWRTSLYKESAARWMLTIANIDQKTGKL